MTKAEIVQAVYSRLGGFSKKESADLVDLVASAVSVVAHAFGVWPGAVGPAFEQGRAFAVSRAADNPV